jgi:NAD(P)-dependent dehydrogenase (short-subunit alcohol dehydrogenase family)
MKPSNRTFIVSGGCSGLGLQTARDLHAAGAYVSLLDLNAGAGEKIVKELGERSKFFEVDVSNTESVEAAVNGSMEWVKQTGKAVGGVIAAAGVGGAAKVSVSPVSNFYHSRDYAQITLELTSNRSTTLVLNRRYLYRK